MPSSIASCAGAGVCQTRAAGIAVTGIISSVSQATMAVGLSVRVRVLAISLETVTNTADSRTTTAPRPISSKPGLRDRQHAGDAETEPEPAMAAHWLAQEQDRPDRGDQRARQRKRGWLRRAGSG